jgi:hypothetical protein
MVELARRTGTTQVRFDILDKLLDDVIAAKQQGASQDKRSQSFGGCKFSFL